MKIQNILATKGSQVVTVRTGQMLTEAINLLVQHNIGAVIVLDDAGQVGGILSERDIVRAVNRGEDLATRRVLDVMTRRVIFGSPQDDLTSVMQTMTVKRFRHLPILDRGKLVGLISIGDIVKAKLDEYQGAVETLETQIIGN
jgi:CBS domain-containing protein